MVPADNSGIYQAENILVLEEALVLISELKESKKIVGLCHGGFDLLHPGQVKHIESAKKLCDILFVSITSDKFVTSRKGDGRPIFTDKLRAYIVANLKFVDYVIISDYKSAIDVIKNLKPSVYIKGSDFMNKMTPGIMSERQAVMDVGGEIRYTNDSKLSTTEIIEYIQNKVDKKKILLCIDRDGTLIEEQNFLGKKEDWRNDIKLKENIISIISYLQTRYQTTKIVISNQGGVARGYFTCKRVQEINDYLGVLLKSRGINIDSWEYCPYVDSEYAYSKKNEIKFEDRFVRDETKRKPSDKMILDSLKKLDQVIDNFDKIIIMGDRVEDEMLAKKLNAIYISSNEKYSQVIQELDSKLF